MAGILLPAAVQERLPSLRDSRVLFFDFGVWYRSDGEEPAVVVLTDKLLSIATFPKATNQPLSLPLTSLSGISRNNDRITLRCSTAADVQLMLPKADTFVVHLLDVQDRRMNRALHLSSVGGGTTSHHGADISTHDVDASAATTRNGGDQPSTSIETAAKALRDARAILAEQNETYLGVLRLGRASVRTEVPVKEVDEGSDASSVQTVQHEVVAEEAKESIDVAPIVVDSTALYRRLWYFFLHYDRTKLRTIDDIISRHRGLESFLMQNLESVYGPEPSRMRWETRDQLAHQREIHLQLNAQLARAKDELLLMAHEEAQLNVAMDRVSRRREEILRDLDATDSSSSAAAAIPPRCKKYELLQVRGDHISEFFFPAPSGFCDFIADQARIVPGGQSEPLCILRKADAVAHHATMDSNGGSGSGQRGGSSVHAVTVSCNKQLLSVWAQQLGTHSVGIMKSGRWKFIPGVQFWAGFY